MRFGVLGPLTVWDRRGEPVAVPEAKVRALLADLLIDMDRPISADRLLHDVWGEARLANPEAVLRSKISQLRRVLSQAAPDGGRALGHEPSGYRLRVESEDVDALRFAALRAEAEQLADPAERVAILDEALSLWRGPAFAEVADLGFARAAITRLTEERLTALESRAEAKLALPADVGVLAEELTELADLHPLRERLRTAQLHALYRTSRQAEALAAFRRFRERLRDELGLDPGPGLAALHQRILRHDPGLTPAAPTAAARTGGEADPARSGGTTAVSAATSLLPSSTTAGIRDGSPAPRSATANSSLGPGTDPGETTTTSNRLPSSAGPTDLRGGAPTDRSTTAEPDLAATVSRKPLTALIGREKLLADLAETVPGSRLTSLVGPGGVGKTRLAAAVAEQLEGRFPDGVRFVELTGIPRDCTREQVAERVAARLGVRDRPGAEPRADDRLAQVLRDKELLLILDNCEHLLDAAADLLVRLLPTAPGVRALTTSREPLDIPGELVRVVPPLDLPTDAVALFVARACAADPGFRLTHDNAATVAAICRRLDGLPLALELAATRVRGLGVRQLAERLDDRFRLLAGNRGAPARHQTLRATIDWSWELLDPVERAVLRRIALHPDCCTLAAAVAVSADEPGSEAAEPDPPVTVTVSAADAVDALARLVDRSLVTLDESSPETRYRLLESVSAYGVGKLEAAGELEPAQDRFHRHYLELAEAADSRIRGPGQRQAMSALDAESVNLRAVLDGMVRCGRIEEALRLGNALAWYWNLRGRLSEARRSFALVLSVPADAPISAARARALAWRSALAIMTGDCDDPQAEFRTGLRGFAEVSDPLGQARSRWLLASLVAYGEPSAGPLAVSEALERFTELDDRWGIAAAYSTLSWLALGRSDLAAARRDGERSLAMYRDIGDHWGQLQALAPLVSIAEIHGEYPTATGLLRQSLRLARRLELWPEVSYQLSGLGRIALLTGRPRLADRMHGQALRLARDHADNYGRQLAELGLALGARRQSRLAEAEGYLRSWLEWNRDRDGHAAVALMAAQLGFIAIDRGDAKAASALHTESLTAARHTGDPRAIAFAWEGLAGAAALSGRHGRAAWLLGAAASARASVTAPLPDAERADVDRTGAAARSALGEAGFAERFAAGEAAANDPLRTDIGTDGSD